MNIQRAAGEQHQRRLLNNSWRRKRKEAVTRISSYRMAMRKYRRHVINESGIKSIMKINGSVA